MLRCHILRKKEKDSQKRVRQPAGDELRSSQYAHNINAVTIPSDTPSSSNALRPNRTFGDIPDVANAGRVYVMYTYLKILSSKWRRSCIIIHTYWKEVLYP